MKVIAGITALAAISGTVSAFGCGGYGCPQSGNVFPLPKKLSDASLKKVSVKIKNLIESMANDPAFYVDNDSKLKYGGGTFSVALTSPESTFFEHHNLGTVTEKGTKEINADSVYRVGSISKVITTLAMLITAQDKSSGLSPDDCITKYYPELGKDIREDGPQWDEITLRSLASHTSGLDKESGLLDVFSIMRRIPDFSVMGFPKLEDGSKEFMCRTGHGSPECTDETIISWLKDYANPTFSEASDRSTYSNAGFTLLAMALAKHAKTPYNTLMQNLICTPSGMTSTGVRAPKSNYVIPTEQAGWDTWNGPLEGAGGVFSSAGDLTKMMRAIFNTKLISRGKVNEWFKPASYSGNLYGAYGMPWEIYRLPSSTTNSKRIVDVYTKAGLNYQYGSLMFIFPDWNIGGVALAAGVPGWALSDALGLTIVKTLPAEIEEIAREHTRNTYAGKYEAVDKPNTFVVLSVQDDEPGIRIDSWSNGGTDMVEVVTELSGTEGESEIRLFPTSRNDSPGTTIQFRGIVGAKGVDQTEPVKKWPLTDNTMINYGGRPIIQMKFKLEKDGKVSELEIPFLRLTLRKTG